MRQRIRIVASVLLALAFAGACTQQKVDEAHVGVRYTDGPIDGKKFDKVVEPGGSEWTANDHVYQLPARQVTYILDADGVADAPPLVVTMKGGEKLVIELANRFFLNTNEDTLKPFFLEICQKHDCWEDEGWISMLDETFGNPLKAVARDLGLEYEADELRYNNATKDEFAAEFATKFVAAQESLIGRGDYFCGPGYKRGEESCPSISVEITDVRFQSDELEGIKTKQRLAEEQEELAVQEEAAARAQQRVNEAKATPEFAILAQAEAMKKCAENPECSLTIIVSPDGGLDVTVPTG